MAGLAVVVVEAPPATTSANVGAAVSDVDLGAATVFFVSTCSCSFCCSFGSVSISAGVATDEARGVAVEAWEERVECWLAALTEAVEGGFEALRRGEKETETRRTRLER
jgi:hypothetical protein